LKQGRAFPSWCCSVPGRPCALAGAGDAGGETAFYSLPAPSLTGVSTAGEKSYHSSSGEGSGII